MSLHSTDESSGAVYAIAVQEDSKILIAGSIGSGGPRTGVARFEVTGSFDDGFGPKMINNNDVQAMLLQSDGKIVVGGGFSSANGVTRNRVARLNSDGTLDLQFNSGLGVQGVILVDEYGFPEEFSTVLAIAREQDGKILIGGNFTTVNGIVRPYIARLFGREASDVIVVHQGAGMVQVMWDTGVLQSADQITGPWSDLPTAESPLLYQTGETQKFFRLKFN